MYHLSHGGESAHDVHRKESGEYQMLLEINMHQELVQRPAHTVWRSKVFQALQDLGRRISPSLSTETTFCSLCPFYFRNPA